MNASAYPATLPYNFPLSWQSAGRRLAPALDLPRLCRDAALILALLLLNKAGSAGATVFFIILALMVFRSPESAFKAIAICYLGLMLNNAFVPKTLVWTPSRLIIPYLALIRFSSDMAALRQSLFARSSYIAFLFFVACMAVCSVVSGWFTHIALLKLANYLIFMTMLFSAVAVLRARRSDLGEWFMSLIIAATLIGVGSIVFGVSRNFRQLKTAEGTIYSASGFNGAFVHPNAHATYASMLIAFLAVIWILSRYRRTWLTLPLMACWFVFMGWSGSRTAFIASLCAIAMNIAYARPVRNRLGWRLWPNVNRLTLVSVAVVASVTVMILDISTGGSVTKSVVSFINKGSDTALDTQQIISSRKQLVEYSWQNFNENPLFGIGFGVAKTEMFRSLATLFTAPAEKGFLPTAILEEGGLLGTGAFLIFLLMFVGDLLRDRNIAGLITFITFLITNIGEVTIFAPGGGGAFGWTMVGAAMVLGDRCWSPPPVMAHRATAGYTKPVLAT